MVTFGLRMRPCGRPMLLAWRGMCDCEIFKDILVIAENLCQCVDESDL